METLIETAIRAGAHFRRRGEGEAPVFVPAGRRVPRPRRRSDTGPDDDPPPGGVEGDGPQAGARHGRRLYRSGRFRDLADFAEDLERRAWRRGDDRARALARVLAGKAALEQGRLVFARMRFAGLGDLPLPPVGEALRLLRAARVGLGRTALAEGARERAVSYFGSALTARGGRGDDPALVAARRGLGRAYAGLGFQESASTELRRALRRARAHGDPLETPLTLAALARLAAARRGPDADRRLARLAEAAAGRTESPLATIEALRARAARRAAEGGAPILPPESGPRRAVGARDVPRLREGLEDLRRALAVALETGAALRQARVHRDAAAVLDALGRPGDADDRRARARELLARGRS